MYIKQSNMIFKTVKHAHVITCNAVLKAQRSLFLSCHRTFHINIGTSFRRSPVLKDHFFFVLKVTVPMPQTHCHILIL